MARPQKEGLDYFPLDVNIDEDDKFLLLEAKYGIVGFGVIIKLFMKIYKEGYYYAWTEKEQLLHSKRVNVDINRVIEIVNDAIKWGIFNENKFNQYGILTSCGIQKRYVEAIKRRKNIVVVGEFWVFDNNKEFNVNIIFKNALINPQRKEKKSKVKESKEKSALENAIDDFIEFRKKSKKPMTKRAIELLMIRLDKLASDDESKIAILNQSILNSWIGIFPIKESGDSTKKPHTKQSSIEMLKELYEEAGE